MKAQENVVFERTQGDTDPIVTKLMVQEYNGHRPVANTAVVTMNVAATPVITLTATPLAGNTGQFLFPASGLSSLVESTRFEVQVVENAVTFTIARGTIKVIPQIG